MEKAQLLKVVKVVLRRAVLTTPRHLVRVVEVQRARRSCASWSQDRSRKYSPPRCSSVTLVYPLRIILPTVVRNLLKLQHLRRSLGHYCFSLDFGLVREADVGSLQRRALVRVVRRPLEAQNLRSSICRGLALTDHLLVLS